jgi:hypothetical protein
MFFINFVCMCVCVCVGTWCLLGYLSRVTPGLMHVMNYVNKKMLLVLCLVGVLESWWIYDSIMVWKPVLQKWLLCVCLFVCSFLHYFCLSFIFPTMPRLDHLFSSIDMISLWECIFGVWMLLTSLGQTETTRTFKIERCQRSVCGNFH